MTSSIFRKSTGKFIAVLLILVLITAAGSVWLLKHSTTDEFTRSESSPQSPVQLTTQPLSAKAALETHSAALTETRVEAVVSIVPPQVSAMTPSQAGRLLPVLIFAGIGVLGIMAAIIYKRRSRLAWLSTLLVLVLLTASLPAPAFAGTGTLTRWTLPHTFSDYAYALAKDTTNGVVYFAERMVGGTSGRIGQLNLTTNDLVEWPTTGLPGYSMALAGGGVFFTEPAANMIGKLEPAANRFTRWQLPSAGGDAIIFWNDGTNIWYFSQSAARIGRLNPSTNPNEITEWTLAAGTAIRFYGRDAAGLVWFSIPGEAKIGRLDLTGNQITMWTLPTELTSVLAVNGNTVWFGGVKDLYTTANYYTVHVGKLDTGTNQVTRWTVVPTDQPGEYAVDFGYWDENPSYNLNEFQVATGRCRQLAVIDSTGKPWFVLGSSRGNSLTRLDPTKNQLLEFAFNGYKLLDIDARDVISALYRGIQSSYIQDTVVFFDTTTSSETRFVLPWPPQGGYGTNGFLRPADTEFWFTRAPIPGVGGEIERLVITP